MLPADWEMTVLADVADYRAGRTPARANPVFWEGPHAALPWVSIADMTEYQIVSDTKEKITPQAAEAAFRGRYSPAGTLLMSFKLTIGRVATLGVDAFHNEAIISIFPREGIDQRYLGYWLSQIDYDRLHDRQIKGNTLNQEKIDRIPVARPPRKEQAHIADVLDTVRKSISIQADSLELVAALKHAAMRELFSRGLRGEAQKDTKIDSMPGSWSVETVANAVLPLRFDRAKQLQTGHYQRSGKWPIIDQGQKIAAGFTDDEDVILYPDVPVIVFGDHTRTLKYVQEPFALGADGTKPLMAAEGWHPKFLFHALCNLEIPSRGYNRHYKQFAESLIARPGDDEQQDIVSILDAIDAKIDLHKRKKAVLEELFRALLHKLMAGEIRVADLDLSALAIQQDVAA